jgi:hypothetical protein
MVFEINLLKLVRTLHLGKLILYFVNDFLILLIEEKIIIERWSSILILMLFIYKGFKNSLRN